MPIPTSTRPTASTNQTATARSAKWKPWLWRPMNQAIWLSNAGGRPSSYRDDGSEREEVDIFLSQLGRDRRPRWRTSTLVGPRSRRPPGSTSRRPGSRAGAISRRNVPRQSARDIHTPFGAKFPHSKGIHGCGGSGGGQAPSPIPATPLPQGLSRRVPTSQPPACTNPSPRTWSSNTEAAVMASPTSVNVSAVHALTGDPRGLSGLPSRVWCHRRSPHVAADLEAESSSVRAYGEVERGSARG